MKGMIYFGTQRSSDFDALASNSTDQEHEMTLLHAPPQRPDQPQLRTSRILHDESSTQVKIWRTVRCEKKQRTPVSASA